MRLSLMCVGGLKTLWHTLRANAKASSFYKSWIHHWVLSLLKLPQLLLVVATTIKIHVKAEQEGTTTHFVLCIEAYLLEKEELD